jgi:pre-mRNA-processing factor 39
MTSEEEPADYAALVAMVHEAEGGWQTSQDANAAARMRAAYDALLAEFPLCYGYWKRYADMEAAAAATDDAAVSRANAVYERGLTLGRHCVELWTLYAAHATARWTKPDDVRSLFERAAKHVGTDYGADIFWERYIAFETKCAGADHSRVFAIYRRLLQLPIRSLDALWLRFQQLAVERSCDEILDGKDEAALQQQVCGAGGGAREREGSRGA